MKLKIITGGVIWILLVSLVLAIPVSAEEQETLVPSSVAVRGTIVDNYVNLTYTFVFDNTESDTATEISWFAGVQEGLTLSNISIRMGNTTYWGRLAEVQRAIEEYNESVQANKTAALVLSTYGGYEVRFNIEADATATLVIYIEGLLVRVLGRYDLSLPVSKMLKIRSDFSLDISIHCTYEDVIGYRVRGIDGFHVHYLADGVRLTYEAHDYSIPSDLAVTYALTTSGGDSKILTYTNGTHEFFVYLLAPVVTEPGERAARQYVFVIDVSGSMSGEKLAQAKEAFSSMIGELSSQDLFDVIAFSNGVTKLWGTPQPGTTDNIDAAQDWVMELEPLSSTNFYSACIDGLDTFVGGEYVRVMIVLSDGLPTSGPYTDPEIILNDVREANDLNVSISTIAFGSDADTTLMANLASQNRGYFKFIEPGSEATAQMLRFYQMLSTPIATSFSISITGATEVNTQTGLSGSPFFNGTEVMITGRYLQSLTINTTVDFVTGTVHYDNEAGPATTEKPQVEKIWAQDRIRYLQQLAIAAGNDSLVREEIVWLSLHYGVVVKGYTGLILTTEMTIQDTATAHSGVTGSAGAYPPGTVATVTDTLPAAGIPVLNGLLVTATIGIVAIGVAVLVWIWRRRLR
ncbi:MAG: hypothetical protein DRO93_03420 [Candidatus Thorarchaeota archaeon]|nr:MAG: hypothetical protein DRO93_03420 [Candidatus Thorarchaeota archaeon]